MVYNSYFYSLSNKTISSAQEPFNILHTYTCKTNLKRVYTPTLR